jgi:Leucine-rich repeat (LRR) protein
MKKKLWVGILIGLIFGIVVVSSLIIMKQQATKVDTFPDKNLERAVRKAIGKPRGPIRAANLENLTVLVASWEGITDLTGLEYCTNLKELRLGGNQISDISALSKLTNLERLYLWGNQISGIKPLVSNSGLSKGDVVYLRDNPLSFISTNVYIPRLEKRGVSVYYE